MKNFDAIFVQLKTQFNCLINYQRQKKRSVFKTLELAIYNQTTLNLGVTNRRW